MPELVKEGRAAGFTEQCIRSTAQRMLERGELKLDGLMRLMVSTKKARPRNTCPVCGERLDRAAPAFTPHEHSTACEQVIALSDRVRQLEEELANMRGRQ
jgi:hypothetical protein